MRHAFRIAALALLLPSLFAACGVASIATVIPYDDYRFDSLLVGSWVSDDSTESVVIRGEPDTPYQLAYTEEEGSVSHLTAYLGTIGRHRVLDVMPARRVEMEAMEGDIHRSLTRAVHGIVVVHSITASELWISFIDPDSLRAALERDPAITPNHLTDDDVLLTGDTPAVQRFLRSYLDRPGVLSKPGVFRRRRP